MTQEHSFCNVCFLGRQNELFGDIRTSVGDLLLREFASAALELVSSELDVQRIFALKPTRARIYRRDFASLLIALRKIFLVSCFGVVQ